MNNDRINKLENNYKFKKNVFGKGIWKNYSFIPPSLLLFVGILGIMYLLQMDKLLTWHSIPFFAVFLAGTIWFKATKKYLIEKKISEATSFLVCLCVPFGRKGNDSVFLFSTGKNRNNKYYLEKEKKDASDKYPDCDFVNVRNKAVGTDQPELYLTMISSAQKRRLADKNRNTDNYWLVYHGNDDVSFLSLSDINRYS